MVGSSTGGTCGFTGGAPARKEKDRLTVNRFHDNCNELRRRKALHRYTEPQQHGTAAPAAAPQHLSSTHTGEAEEAGSFTQNRAHTRTQQGNNTRHKPHIPSYRPIPRNTKDGNISRYNLLLGQLGFLLPLPRCPPLLVTRHLAGHTTQHSNPTLSGTSWHNNARNEN